MKKKIVLTRREVAQAILSLLRKKGEVTEQGEHDLFMSMPRLEAEVKVGESLSWAEEPAFAVEWTEDLSE